MCTGIAVCGVAGAERKSQSWECTTFSMQSAPVLWHR